MSSKEEDLNDGVKHISMTNFLQDNESDSPDLFIRQCQKELWGEVLIFLESLASSRAIVTGNPGIGKSRSMNYFLKLLLIKRKTVIFEARKDLKAFIFVPQEGSLYKVWFCMNFNPTACAALNNQSNY